MSDISKTRRVIDAVMGALANIEGATNLQLNSSLPEEVPAEGLIIVRDGKPDAPEETLGGFDSVYMRRVIPIEVFVEHEDDALREATFDAVLRVIGERLIADRTLGGQACGLTITPPEPVTESAFSGSSVKAGTIEVAVEYEAPSALG